MRLVVDRLHDPAHPAVARMLDQRGVERAERVTAAPDLHTPDLSGKATARQVTDAVIAAIQGDNEESVLLSDRQQSIEKPRSPKRLQPFGGFSGRNLEDFQGSALGPQKVADLLKP